MRLTTYNPWNSLNRPHSNLDNIFNYWPSLYDEDETTTAMSAWTPTVDIKDEENRYVFMVDVPGVNAEDINITMENGVLTIEGERKLRDNEEDKGYQRTERVQGKFHGRFNLPDTVDGEGIQAKSKDGVLEVIIPKQEQAKPRRITVSS